MTVLDAFSQWVTESPWPCPTIVLLVFLESSPVIGMLVPGILLLPVLGSLSGQRLMSFSELLACAAAGAMLADSLGYWLGRLGYTEWHRKLGGWRSRRLQKQVDVLFERYGRVALFGGRIMWGIHPLVPMAAGAIGIRILSFYIIDTIAILVWLGLYMGSGHGLGVLLRRLEPANAMMLVAGLVTLVALTALTMRWRRRDHT